MTVDSTNPTGLVISATEPILTFLNSACRDPHISVELRQIASDLVSKPNNVPYKSLRAIWVASDVVNRPNLAQLLSGSEFVLISPKPREKVNEPLFRLSFLLMLILVLLCVVVEEYYDQLLIS